jgi:hypothetical protein
MLRFSPARRQASTFTEAWRASPLTSHESHGRQELQPRATVPDFQSPNMHDELRLSVRKAPMQDAARETFTFRNKVGS